MRKLGTIYLLKYFCNNIGNVMQKIGKRLADLRKKNHFKQTELAEKLNVSQQVISNIERELTVPDIEFLKSAADLYKISLDQLVGRDFLSEETDDIEQKIISYIKQMDDKGKELSLDLLSQVAKHQGNKDGNE